MINLGNIELADLRLGASQVKAAYFGSKQIWGGEEPGPVGDWLCFTAEQNGSTLRLDKNGSPGTIYLETSRNGRSWTDYSWTNSTGDTLTLASVGDKVYFRAKSENRTIGNSTWSYYKFSMTGKIAASGNIQTLLKADGSRTDAPAYCYQNMFNGCQSLTAAPTLAAETLGTRCYSQMFYNCSSLTTAPEILATTVGTYSCNDMFKYCSSLTTPPTQLPALTLGQWSYNGMFSNCTSLTSAPALPATTLATFCYSYTFEKCTSLTSAPALPATTLVGSCYNGMFSGCTHLSSVEVPFTAWNPSNATDNWLENVAASGTFTCPAELPDERGTNRIPTGWTVAHPAPAATPLCFTAEGSNASVALMHGSSAPSISMEYSLDNEAWDSYTLGTTVTLANKGDKVYFRAADVNAGMSTAVDGQWQSQYNNWFDCQNVSVSGKIVSVLRKDMDESLTYTNRQGVYRCMLRNYNSRNPQIVSAKDLQLPQLSSFGTQAFMSIFGDSTISAAPTLPTNCVLKNEAFCYFFENCDKLSSIDSPMMTITGFSNISHWNDPPFNNTFVRMDNFNQEELVLVLSGISDYPNYCLAAVFEGNTSFTGKFILDMTSYTSVPTIQSNTFNNYTKPANGTLEIHVPASLYDTWKVATNWTTWSSYLVPVS